MARGGLAISAVAERFDRAMRSGDRSTHPKRDRRGHRSVPKQAVTPLAPAARCRLEPFLAPPRRHLGWNESVIGLNEGHKCDPRSTVHDHRAWQKDGHGRTHLQTRAHRYARLKEGHISRSSLNFDESIVPCSPQDVTCHHLFRIGFHCTRRQAFSWEAYPDGKRRQRRRVR